MRIVIPGGAGQVGRVLARHWHNNGHTVTVLTRKPMTSPWRTVHWNGSDMGPWIHEIDGADVVVNLAGRSVDCRYTEANRREIKESRIRTTRLIGDAIAGCDHPPSLWLNASTATIYRHAFDRPMDEASGELGGTEPDAPETWRFSIEVAVEWEKTFFEAATPRTRKVALRSAMTMSADRGGVFDKHLRLVRCGLGGRIGSGRQFVSWIHELDFIRAVEFLIGHGHIDGTVNLSAPNPVPNAEFMRILRNASGIRFGLPTPEWMLEFGAFFLRTETELILKSRRVIPGRLLDEGFEFRFPDWEGAARDLIRRATS
jgi:uncharacterized protein (TIGR01777 family)